MAYVRRRGVGEVVPVPLSSWGLVGAPCVMGAAASLSIDPRCGGADSSSTALDFISSPMGLGILAAVGVALYAGFRRGR